MRLCRYSRRMVESICWRSWYPSALMGHRISMEDLRILKWSKTSWVFFEEKEKTQVVIMEIGEAKDNNKKRQNTFPMITSQIYIGHFCVFFLEKTMDDSSWWSCCVREGGTAQCHGHWPSCPGNPNDPWDALKKTTMFGEVGRWNLSLFSKFFS